MRRPHLQADDEEKHHHPKLGGVQDGLRIVEQTKAERPNRQTGGQITQHRAQPQALEQRHGHHGGAQ